MSEAHSRVHLAVEDGVAVITISRPEAYNAFDDELKVEFSRVVDHVSEADEVRSVVITGAGTAFSAGGDVKEMPERLEKPPGEIAFQGWRRQRRIQQGVVRLHNLEKPTIAAVNGVAAGLGADIALACDFILMATSASFRMSFVMRGLVPDGGGIYFLPRRVGIAVSKELIFTGRAVDCEEALEIGLADRVSDPSALLADAKAWGAELAGSFPAAIALSKAMLNKSLDLTLEESLMLSAQAQAICYTTDEHGRSVRDFVRKQEERKNR